MKTKRRSHETGCLVVVGRRNDARHGRALPAADSGPGPGALLLEDSVGCECGAAHRQLDERQHEPVRPCSHRDAGSELRRHHGPGGLCAHLFPVRSRGHGCDPPAHGANLGRGHSGRQDVQPIGQRVRRPDDRVQHQSHSARRRRRTSPTSCATSRGSLSTCSPTWRCRSASTTATSP